MEPPAPARSIAPHLILIASVHLAVQAGLIAARVAPARDGARYVRSALRLEKEPWGEVIRSTLDHPGYPIFLHGVFSTARAAGIGSPRGLVLAAEAANSILGLVLVVIGYLAARRMWGVLPAVTGSLALVLLPRPAGLMSDVLSDPLHAMLWMASAAAVLGGLRSSRAAPFLGAGLLGGLAYWVRVDALTLPASVLGLAAALFALEGRWPDAWPRRRSLLAGALYLAGFAALLAVFVAVKGELSGKPAAEDILGRLLEGPAGPHGRGVALAGAGLLPSALWDVILEIGQEVQFVHLLAVGCAIAVAARVSRLTPGGAFLGVTAAVYVSVLVIVRARTGYFTGRYALPFLPLFVPFGVWGVTRLAAGWGAHPAERARARQAIAAFAVLGASIAASLPSFLAHRPHDNYHGVLEAGKWVRDHAGADEALYDPYFFPSFLAGVSDRTVEELPREAGARKTWAIAQDRDLPRLPEIEGLIRAGRAREVAAFPRAPGGERRDVRVYEVGPAGSP